ncbi:MAG TPA: sugar ABC transporter permease [Terriglobia bacterium]|nr:sugar ABC transporter permease [Terriglobia bacterium]
MQFPTRLPKATPDQSLRTMGPLARREARNGLLFISPWIIGFLAFTLLPMLITLAFSFMNLKLLDNPFDASKFVGFKNYIDMLKDPQVWNVRPDSTPGSFWVTVRYGLIAVPISILLPMGIALLVNSKALKGHTFFRAMFYMPYIVPFIASIFLWAGVLNPQFGWVNLILLQLGVPRESLPGWIFDVNWVYPAYVILGIWGIGNAMLTMLAGMQAVPTDLYDAAKVDGAGGLARFWYVTFPMISPVVFYNLILSIVALFQYFLVPLALNTGNTSGFPGGLTMFYNLYLYLTFFVYQNMSYGSTLAWFLFLIILIVTLILFATARFWVYYAGERQ